MRLNSVSAVFVIVPALLGSSGCSLFRYDHGKAIAYRTMFNADGKLDEPAYSAALSAKFPVGSSLQPLRAYVATNGGECSEREENKLWCEIPVRGQPCAATLIGIDVRSKSGSIESLRVASSEISC